MDTFTWRDELLANVHGIVQKHDWQVIHVGRSCDAPGCPGDPEALSEYAYTVGLPSGFDHPEVLMTGLDPTASHYIIQTVCEQIRSGARFDPGDVIESDEFILKAVAVDDAFRVNGTIAISLTYHNAIRPGQVPELIQLVWPDENGRFPDDPQCDQATRDAQPLLSIRPNRATRRRQGQGRSRSRSRHAPRRW